MKRMCPIKGAIVQFNPERGSVDYEILCTNARCSEVQKSGKPEERMRDGGWCIRIIGRTFERRLDPDGTMRYPTENEMRGSTQQEMFFLGEHIGRQCERS